MREKSLNSEKSIANLTKKVDFFSRGKKLSALFLLLSTLVWLTYGGGCSGPPNPAAEGENGDKEVIETYDASDEVIPEKGPGEQPAEGKDSDQKTVEKEFMREWKFRIIAGVSMGGAFSSMIGLRNPDKFDIIGTLGGPNDHTYLLHYIERSMMGGFCPPEKLEALMKAGVDLNSPKAYCAPPSPPAQFPFEFTSDFNNWHYDDSGGNWNRTGLIRVLQDVFLALGNPFYYNPNSPYWPHPKIPNDRRKELNRCSRPIRIKGVKVAPYNSEGKYDLITFCDGNSERDGVYRPDKPHTVPIEFALAVDLNGNGKRDYGEPLAGFSRERFQDVGIDGCPDPKEDGKGGCLKSGKNDKKDPNGDNYDPIENPTGTENNMFYDKGEPFLDYGLDGVKGTGDYGEGDGKFTISPMRENWYRHDPHQLVLKMDMKKLKQLNIYIDGGIRDLFNFHVTGLNLLGAIRARFTDQPDRAKLYNRLISLTPGASKYNPFKVDWSDKGQYVYVRYGNPNATPEEIAKGDGDHVHGAKIIDRVFTFFSFASAQLPNPDLEKVTVDIKKGEGIPKHYVFPSKALGGRMYIYSVVLPPGFYSQPNKKYPVVYFGHGYGMDGPGLAKILALLVQPMARGLLAKMIMVAVHGRCEEWIPKNGKFAVRKIGNCHKGTFYVNGRGLDGKGLAMEDAFFEVVREVEKRFKGRILEPKKVLYKVPVKK